jgi:alpha/beta superfamily hydrolase
VTEVRVSFPTPDGLALEGLLSRGETGRGGILLCHPHPLYGGDMYNNVIGGVQGALVQGGFSTLRFNFRGGGGSGGGYGEGVGEMEDVRGAVDFFMTELGADVPLYLLGYSFGAYVGVKGVAADERVKVLICISPPVAMYDFAALKEEKRPILIISGEGDMVCPVGPVKELYLSLPQPKMLHIIPGVDHFWWGMEDRVADYVIDFLLGLERG